MVIGALEDFKITQAIAVSCGYSPKFHGKTVLWKTPHILAAGYREINNYNQKLKTYGEG